MTQRCQHFSRKKTYGWIALTQTGRRLHGEQEGGMPRLLFAVFLFVFGKEESKLCALTVDEDAFVKRRNAEMRVER